MDFLKSKQSFKNYVSNFKCNDEKINVKIKHTFGVVKIAEYIARGLNLLEADVELAKLIGLLHDIGRFEQAARYNNFSDHETMDHAEYGVKLLFEDGLIRNFIAEDTYDEIIMKAIYNHNKFKIESGLSEKELLHAKIIRDADKTDNFLIKQYQDFWSLFRSSEVEVEKEMITDSVWNEFQSRCTIVTSHRITNMDKWLSYIAWIYDYNFDVSLRYLKDNNCIDKVIDRLNYKNPDTKTKMEVARMEAKEYIDSRLNCEDCIKK